MIFMMLGMALLVLWTMVTGLRFHLFLQRHAPELAASPLTRDRLVLAGFVIGSVMAARFFENLAW